MKRGASPTQNPRKKRKKRDGYSKEKPYKQDCWDLPSDDVVISMLKIENELRLSEDVQQRCEEVERSGCNTDWIEVASEVQKEVLG